MSSLYFITIGDLKAVLFNYPDLNTLAQLGVTNISKVNANESWSDKGISDALLGSCNSNGVYTGFTGTVTQGDIIIGCTGSQFSLKKGSSQATTLSITPNSCYCLGIRALGTSVALMICKINYGVQHNSTYYIHGVTDNSQVYGDTVTSFSNYTRYGFCYYISGRNVIVSIEAKTEDVAVALSSQTNGIYNDSVLVVTNADFINDNSEEEPPEDTDPYSAGGGSSETGGGGGDFNNTSDTVGIPSDPTISATDTGFMTVFATNISGLQSLANALWSDLFPETFSGESLHETAEALKNIVGSPYDAILGCHIVPVAVPTGASKSVKMYGVLPFGVSLPVASTQWITKDCGTLNINEHWGAYLDYSPYTKVTSLYLPFVGVVSVDIDMIMGKTLGVQYKIDIVSGQCVAFITVNGSVEFQYQGHCACPLPITSIDWSNTVSAGLGLVGSVTNIVGSAVGGALAGGVGGAISGGVMGAMGQAGAIAQNVMNSKPDIKSGSGIGGSAGLMGCKKPFLIIERPRQSVPKKGSNSQNHWTGYPSNTAQKLGDLEGYTEVSRIFVNRTNATAQEKEEIERLLHEGVYF